MTLLRLALIITLAALSVALVGAQELPMVDVLHHETFEDGEDPFRFWVANGDYQINFKGVTDERAFEGERSFKLDVTLESGSYFYWSIPVRIPAEGELTFSARIHATEEHTATAGLGLNWVFPPTTHSGCGPFDDAREPTDGWKLITGDAVTEGAERAAGVLPRYVAGGEGTDVGVYVDRIGLFVRGRAGTRGVIYVDDIRLEGRVVEDEPYQEAIAGRWQSFAERWDGRVAQWRERLAAAENAFADAPALPEDVAEAGEATKVALERARETVDQLDTIGYGRPTVIDQLEADLRMIELAPVTMAHITSAMERGERVATFAVPAITNARILPTAPVVPGEPGAPLEISACRGEYESASFVVMPLGDVSALWVAPSPLTGDAGAIPAEQVDVKLVKVWYQAGRGITDLHNRQLVPELLLNDGELVRVDYEEEHNYLRHTAPDGQIEYRLASGPTSEMLEDVRPIDADELQPVDLPALHLQQYWVTVQVPEDAAAGDYHGTLTLTSEGNPDVQIPLNLRVHEFDLEPAPLIYSIYYRAKLHESGEPTITSEWRSEEQYLAEMLDMKAHGVLYPTIYQRYDEELLPRALEIRAEAGLATDRLFTLGTTTGAPQTEEALESLRARVRQWLDIAERFGYEEVYVYGIDEAKGERLEAQRQAWRAVQEEGAKTFVACYRGTFEAMGDLLDVAVLAHRPDPEEAAKYHGVGSEVFTYAFPQVGPEEPETFRRNYGLYLWQANFDGAMDYAYQHGFNHVWNDFDSDRYRDHNFTYPTVNGIVGTVQWEGWREAVDDTRYLATLLAAIEATGNAEAAAAAQGWIDELDPQRDLYEVRAEMVEHIQACLGLNPGE